MKVTDETLQIRACNAREPGEDSSAVERIRYLIVIMHQTQRSFAHLIGLNPTNLSKILNGRTPVTTGIINRILVNTGVSRVWLTDGVGVPFPQGTGHEPDVVDESPVRMDFTPEGAPVYDIDVTAGAEPLAREFTSDRIIGWLNMPNLTAATPVVRVSGDSMAPRIQNGSFIQIRSVSLDSPLYWGATYVIVLDDFRMVKVVRRNPDPSMVTLHSINTEYDDMEIDRSLIRALFIVQSVFNFDVLS